MLAAQNRGLLSGFARAFGKPARRPAAAPPPGAGRPAEGARWTGLFCGLLLLVAGCGVQGRDHLLLGQRLLQEGRPSEAIEPLQAAIQALQTNAPAAAQAWNYLGLAYHRAGQPAEAARAYKAALDRDFNLITARYNLGALFFEQGNYTAAINELTTYTAHQPKDPAGWLLLGRAQLRAGLLDAADRHLLQALRLNPTPLQQAEALNALGLGQAQRRRAREAFQYFEAALNRVTNYPPALLNQAILSHQVHDHRFALQKYAAYLAVAGQAANAETIRHLTNRLSEQIALALKPTPAPAVPPPATNLLANLRTATPPAATQTAPAPSQVRTTAPPAKPTVTTPPVIAQTSPPPAKVATAAPPPVVAAAKPPAQPPETTPAPPPVAAATPRAIPPGTSETEKPQQTTPGPAPAPTAPAPAAVTPAAVTPKPEPPPAPAVETVQLEAEPEVKPAVDVALAPAATATRPSAAHPTPSATPAPAPAASPTPAPPAATPALSTHAAESHAKEPEPPRKRSFIARLNPLNLIRGAEDPEKAREREAKKAAEQARKAEKDAAKKRPTPVERKTAAAAPAPEPEPPRPVFPRYQYTAPAPPASGNRAEAERLAAEGVTAHRAGRLGEALAAYQRATRADPAHFPAWFNLAVAAFEQRDWPRALAAYETALALDPAHADARYGFALTLERAGYPLDAAAELEKILARDPRHVEAHLALANLCATTLADRDRAREHYLKVLQLQPNHPQAGLIKRWLGPAWQP